VADAPLTDALRYTRARLDTRVKERLVGAVVLVAIIVALVPEMLSGPRPDSAPSTDEQRRTFTIDLSEGATGTAPREVSHPEVPMAAPLPLPAESPAGEVPQSPPPQQAESQAPAAAPAASTRDRSQTDARTEPAPPSRVTNAGWAVQLGSFASKENADRLAAELKQRGYRAFVSRFDSGRSVRHRVRVGPEENRQGAEETASRLRREGRQVSIVAHP
jgi:DedD protein